jgi:hypothetical protein
MNIGSRMRHAREARGLTIDALSRCTRVQPRILSAIEQNDTISLPPRPYGRGFVRAYASEVGLDPDGTVRDFFSQFAPAEPPPVADAPPRAATSRPWGWPLGLALTYAAIGVLVILAGRWAFQRSGERGAVGTTGGQPPAAVATVERRAASAAVPPAAIAGLQVVLEARAPAWVTAVVDGERRLYRALEAGERVSLDGIREISIRTGDAGALSWRVNGRAAAPMGRPGEVRTVRVTPDNAAQVK